MNIFELSIFGITIAPTYYGLMYALSFIICYIIVAKRKTLTENEQDSLLIYIFFGVVLGGRLGYILFYDLSYYIYHLSAIIAVWKGGMSFHGGLIGVILSVYIFSKNHKKNFWKLIDELASIVPIGLGLGRIGNYINKELLGFPYNGPLAVKVGSFSYFPSPLLEAFLEGIILFIIVNYVRKKQKFPGQTSAFFLIGYATCRIIVELFFRMPDEKIGYIVGPFSLGFLLCIPMILLGIYLLFRKTEPTKKTKKAPQ